MFLINAKARFYFVSLISFMVIGIWYVIWLEARSSELYNAVVEEKCQGDGKAVHTSLMIP